MKKEKKNVKNINPKGNRKNPEDMYSSWTQIINENSRCTSSWMKADEVKQEKKLKNNL